MSEADEESAFEDLVRYKPRTAPDCDLVFSDVLLPGGGSGLDLARKIATRAMGVPVVLTSGFGGGVTQRLASVNLPFLRKPYRIEELWEAIDAALQPAAGVSQRQLRAAGGGDRTRRPREPDP